MIVPSRVLVCVLITSTPWLTRSARYMTWATGSKFSRSKLAWVGPVVVQLGMEMIVCCWSPALAAGTFVACASTLDDHEKWGCGPAAAAVVAPASGSPLRSGAGAPLPDGNDTLAVGSSVAALAVPPLASAAGPTRRDSITS